MKYLQITRFNSTSTQTLGTLSVIQDYRPISVYMTLELPDKQNQKRISRIPSGVYKVKKRHSAKFGNHFHVLDVENRSYILIHSGNFHSQILGCILVGKFVKDIDKDGHLDVTSSKKAISELLDQMPNEFELKIIDPIN